MNINNQSPVTFNQVVNTFKLLSAQHKQVNTFYSGQTWNFQTKTNIYPAVVLVAAPSKREKMRLRYNWLFFVLDICNQDQSNIDEVKSDCLQVANDFISELRDNADKYGFVVDETSIPIQYLEQKFDDTVCGVCCTIITDVTVDNDLCNSPFDFNLP